jgi:cytochrome d ubiquinol oxidase subunit II
MIEALLPADQYLVAALPEIWAGAVVFALGMYLVLDGIDFGIGMLFATCEGEADRETLLAAFGPVWDANEVWLVAFATMLLAAFPPVYARLLADHYFLVIGFVLALVFRGLGPELREQRPETQWKRSCDRAFIGGSVVAPLLFGLFAGSWVFDVPALSVPAALTGVAVVAVSVATAAAFLGTKTKAPLTAAMRRHGSAATVVYMVGLLVLVTTVVVADRGGAAETFLTFPGSAVVGMSVAMGIGATLLASRGADRAWLVSSLSLPVLLTLLVALLLFPQLYPPRGLTISEAVVSPVALNLVSVLGFPVLVLVLWYFTLLYRIFSGPIEAAGYGS